MKKLKYRRCEAIIKCTDGDKKVRAYSLASSPGGLIAHKRGDRWVITHKPSGLSVSSRVSYDTLQEALQRIKRLYELASVRNFSWNDSAEKIRNISSLEKEVEKVLRA